jgi:sigma-E factor negative regulatory protein RseC
MIMELGEVIELRGDEVIIRTQRISACGSCESPCAQKAWLQKKTPNFEFALANSVSNKFVVGDKVEIGIEESALMMASLLAYGFPLLTLFSALIISEYLFANQTSLSLVFGVLGLGLGIFISRWIAKNQRQFLEPRIINRISAN